MGDKINHMTDTVTRERRSQIMSKIKSKDSKIETDLRKALWKKGFRFRKNASKYYGKPDMVLPKYKTVIFVDSCFWHGCRWHCRMPSSNKEYWKKKIARNKERDKEVNRHYKKEGWRVIRVWGHQLKGEGNLEYFLDKLVITSLKN